MATTYTSITVIQDNKVGSANYLTINNTLAFIVECTYSGDTPEVLEVRLQIDSIIKGYYNALPYKDVSGTVRQFIFFASDYIKGWLPDVRDEVQALNDIIVVNLPIISLRFNPVGLTSPSSIISFFAINGTRQFSDENGACAVNLHGNTIPYMIAKYGYTYVYFKSTITGTAQVSFNGFALGTAKAVTVNKLYRAKISPLFSQILDKGNEFTINSVSIPGMSITIPVYIPRPYCREPKIVKYLDKNGLFQFMMFEQADETNLSYDSLGSISEYVTSLVYNRGDKVGAGKTKEKEISLKITNLPVEYVGEIESIIESPVTYYHIGVGAGAGSYNYDEDDSSDWLLVECTTRNLRYSISDGKFINTSLSFRMPKQNTITQI